MNMAGPKISMTSIPLDGISNWRLARDNEGLAWLCIDCPDASTNTLSAQVINELATAVEVIAAERPLGLVIYSAKANGFVAGADIREFDQLTDVDQTTERITQVHQLFERIGNLPFSSVARVHGFCLGGGLELALACRHIIAAEESSTRLGFPEILLGLHPGFGGTVRSIRDCGVTAAMDLMLTGRSLNARRARKMGLIDRAVPLRHLDSAVRKFALEKRPRRKPGIAARATNNAVTRPLVAMVLRREVAKRALEQHYPAPYALINLWREHGGDEAAMYRAEARSIAQLFTSPTSRSLVRVFKLQERLKALGRDDALTATRVHVIGAGVMGGDIAAWCALRGMHVTLQDREPKFIAPALKRADKLFARRVRDKYERLAAQDRLIPDFNGDGLRRADVIIEAIIEDVEAKRGLFRQVEQQARPEALLATNTSSIQLSDIASSLSDPGRLVGIHFFNPVAQMQLVEIIASDDTHLEVRQQAAAFTAAIDRLPLPAASAPGFLINRVLSPYMDEAMKLMEEGVAPSEIDSVAKSFGMPMGPIELADTVGLDICLHVGEILGQAFGGEPSQLLRDKVQQKRLGRKTNVGFYEYKKGKVIRPQAEGTPMPHVAIRDRMFLRLLNEAVACLREQIVADADLVDVAMIFGTGFAPFRGGPLNYARDRGIAEITARLDELVAEHGDRFKPDRGWQDIVDG